jgi:hypothetical protein
MQSITLRLFLFGLCSHCWLNMEGQTDAVAQGKIQGRVVDSQTGQPIPCRLTVRGLDDHRAYFASSLDAEGSAVIYDRQLVNTPSYQQHTTLSAHRFSLNAPPGNYRVRAQRGKEWLAHEVTIAVDDQPVELTLRLQRFCDMPKRGWYSGDTHVHLPASDLHNVLPAEDVNVAFPLSYWVRDSHEVPAASGPTLTAEPVVVDPLHIYYPINTEYEIFSVGGKPHTQGAVLVLNHQRPLQLTAPPVGKIAAEARRQGGLLDLEKHSWNWTPMIVPIMQVDLFELGNNHHWETSFGFPKWTLENAPPDWPEIERDNLGFTELGWTEFGLQTYYAFLNCDFRMRVTAGTGSGVHPVALGHSRVYVHCGAELDYSSWIANLDQGHSFVTQGPLMEVRFNDELPGTTWNSIPSNRQMRISGTIDSVRPLARIEAVHNGTVIDLSASVVATTTEAGSVSTSISADVPCDSSGWFALRCFEQPADDAPMGKVILAHTNPVFVDAPNLPLKPRRRDVEYFIARMAAELARNQGILDESALAEFREAKTIYEKILERAQ